MSSLVQEWLFAAAFFSSLVSMAGLYVAITSQRSQLAVQIMLQNSKKFRIMLLAMPLEILHDRHYAPVEPSPELCSARAVWRSISAVTSVTPSPLLF